MKRPSFIDIYMEMANSLAKRSHHPRYKVGCVLTSKDFTQVYSIGYSGFYSGGSNKVKNLKPGKSDLIHGEINCLLKNKAPRSEKKILFTTLSPCFMCAQCIINSKDIDIVYFKNTYRDIRGIKILKKAKIKVYKYEKI